MLHEHVQHNADLLLMFGSACGEIINRILPIGLNGRSYTIVWRSLLPELLKDQEIQRSLCKNMWFQHDASRVHFSRGVWVKLNVTCRQKSKRHCGPIQWAVQSPYLTP